MVILTFYQNLLTPFKNCSIREHLPIICLVNYFQNSTIDFPFSKIKCKKIMKITKTNFLQEKVPSFFDRRAAEIFISFNHGLKICINFSNFSGFFNRFVFLPIESMNYI
jgi:hypothetical protein